MTKWIGSLPKRCNSHPATSYFEYIIYRSINVKYQPLFQGQKFNRLTIIKLDHKKKYIHPNGRIVFREYYLCKCDCGNKTIAYKWYIKSGHTKSCGCWNKEINSKVHTKHGMEGTRIYKIWQGIKKR